MTRLWSLFKRLMTWLTQLLYLLIILGAAAKIMAFGFAIYAENNKQTIEQWASAIVGTPVHFSKIETYWAGITPRLWVRNLSLGDQEKLILGDTLLGINLAALPYWKENLPINIRLTNTHITILREKSGKTRILGLTKPKGTNLPTYVFLENTTIELQDYKRNIHVEQKHLNIKLLSRNSRGSLELFSANRELQLRAEIKGAISKGDWTGTIWAKGQNLQSEQLFQTLLPDNYLLSDLRLGVEAWSYWRQGKHITSRIQVGLDKASLHTPDNETLKFSELQGDILYQKQGTNWTLQLKNFGMLINDLAWQRLDAAIRSDAGKLQLGISHIDLAQTTPLLALLPKSNDSRKLFSMLSPGGNLNSIKASAEHNDIENTAAIEIEFEKLAFLPWKKLPGINNFSGRLSMRKDMANLHLDSHDAQIRFNKLFRDPLPIQHLTGDIRWQQSAEQRWFLESKKLSLDSPHLQTISRIHVEKTPDEPPLMDIQTDFHSGKGEYASLYYPVGIMSKKLVAWLDAAIASGNVSEGSFLYYGPLAHGHFPFHKTHDGHFEVLFNADKLMFSYQKDWPILTDTSARIRFHNNDLSIHADQGRIYDTRIHNTTASIASLKPLMPLQIDGTVSGAVTDYFRLLRETPLKTSFAPRIKDIKITGSAHSRIRIKLPLPAKKITPPKFDIRINFKPGTALTLLSQNLQLDKLKGQLKVTDKGLFADEIKATTMASSINLSAKPIKGYTLIEAQGNISASGLVQQYPQLFSLGLQGSSDMSLAIQIPVATSGADSITKLHLESQLQGISAQLPAPVGKTAENSIALNLDMHLNQTNVTSTLKYGDILGATFKNNQDKKSELLLKISELHTRPWIHHFNQQPQQDLPGLSLEHIRFEADKLINPPLFASTFVLDLRQAVDRWTGSISSDNISGKLAFSKELYTQPFTLNLDKLYLQTGNTSKDNIPSDNTDKLSPGEFPSLRLSSKELRLNQANLGKLELTTSKTGNTQNIDELEIHGKLINLSAHGSWEYSSGSTWLKGILTIDNTGELLQKAWDSDFLSGSKTYLSFDFNWPGAAFQPNIKQLQGEAQLDMSQGRFLNFKPGLARVLGLINFDTLTRRLKLDFKDVYQQGMAFDTIMGNFQFDAGLMYTNNFEISAPSVTILISGSIDLVNETYDQILSISPRLDATLPVAGAIAGGPAAGLVVLLAQQAFSEKLQKIQRITYDVSGSWEDPQLSKLTPSIEKEANDSILNH